MKNANDASSPKKGPAIAKSNIDLSVGGGDLIGVIEDKIPSWIDGIGDGRPT
jgi:hypothetical protein